MCVFFFFQAEDGIRDKLVTGVQTCALPISPWRCAAAPKAASVPVAPPLKRMQSSRFTPAPPRGTFSPIARTRSNGRATPADDDAVVVTRRSWGCRGRWRSHAGGRGSRTVRAVQARLPDRRALPVVVGRPARVVHLPEDELHREVEPHLLRTRVGHLEVEARALDIDHGSNERRARAPGEIVEGE